jgi:4-aminobutyrate aminotransferase-like enzyme
VFLLVLQILNCNSTLANTREPKKRRKVYTLSKHFAGKTLKTLQLERKKENKKKSLKNFSAMYICYCNSRLQQLSKKKKTQLKHNNNSRSSSSSSG